MRHYCLSSGSMIRTWRLWWSEATGRCFSAAHVLVRQSSCCTPPTPVCRLSLVFGLTGIGGAAGRGWLVVVFLFLVFLHPPLKHLWYWYMEAQKTLISSHHVCCGAPGYWGVRCAATDGNLGDMYTGLCIWGEHTSPNKLTRICTDARPWSR